VRPLKTTGKIIEVRLRYKARVLYPGMVKLSQYQTSA